MAWDDREHDAVVKALAVVCEVTGAEFSPAAREFLLRQLHTYPAGEVLTALEHCAMNCTRRLTLGDVVKALTDQREKNQAKRRALASADETRLRIDALTAGIPWEMGKEEVRKALRAIGNGKSESNGYPLLLGASSPQKESLRRQMRHWTEEAEEEPAE